MKKFKKGDKVICRDTSWSRSYAALIAPAKNHIYTIREIHGDSCLLVEIQNKPVADHGGVIVYDPKGSEPIFYLWHFERYNEAATEAVLKAIQKLLEKGHAELFPSGKYLEN